MTNLEILQNIYTLLSDKNNWCQYTLNRIGPDGQNQYCVIGALQKFTRFYPVYYRLSLDLEQTAKELFSKSLHGVNDILGYEAIMELLELQIKKEEEKSYVY